MAIFNSKLFVYQRVYHLFIVIWGMVYGIVLPTWMGDVAMVFGTQRLRQNWWTVEGGQGKGISRLGLAFDKLT